MECRKTRNRNLGLRNCLSGEGGSEQLGVELGIVLRKGEGGGEGREEEEEGHVLTFPPEGFLPVTVIVTGNVPGYRAVLS